MKDTFFFEAEPYEPDTGYTSSESFDSDFADEEWEDEFRRFGRMPGRAPRPRMRTAPRRRLTQRQPRPPKRPIGRPARPPRRPPRPGGRDGAPLLSSSRKVSNWSHPSVEYGQITGTIAL